MINFGVSLEKQGLCFLGRVPMLYVQWIGDKNKTLTRNLVEDITIEQ